MREIIIRCDRCGFEQTPNHPWHEAIKEIKINCPPDGINGGQFKPELCFWCREKLDGLIRNFLADGSIPGGITGREDIGGAGKHKAGIIPACSPVVCEAVKHSGFSFGRE